MMKLAQQKQTAIDLSDTCFGDHLSTYSHEELLSNGVLVNVTAWVHREMGFDPRGYRVQVALSARLWRSVAAIPALARTWQTFRVRGGELLWVASYALRKARRLGLEASDFQAFLPTEGDEEDIKMLRVVCSAGEDRKLVVTVGFADEF